MEIEVNETPGAAHLLVEFAERTKFDFAARRNGRSNEKVASFQEILAIEKSYVENRMFSAENVCEKSHAENRSLSAEKI